MKTEPSFKKTRIAPTPSGFLHLGNVLSFAITAAMARTTGANIVLRIDDLDRERVDNRYVQDIFDTLDFLDIPRDEGPANLLEFESTYSQLHRMDLYRRALQQLKEGGHVFACNCSRAEILRQSPDGIYPGTCRNKNIPLDTENTSWRLHTSSAKELSVKTLSGHMIKADLPASMQDFIVRKKDGFPAYQLTSVLDDLYYGIDLVVRGEDLWPSTLAQHYLSLLLKQDAFLNSTFYHHPLLAGPSGEKLSKSAGDTSVQWLRKQGSKPADVYNRIASALGIEAPVENWQALATCLPR
jgi:glutamyl-tRNA synthetase